jgi:hypothetical protein
LEDLAGVEARTSDRVERLFQLGEFQLGDVGADVGDHDRGRDKGELRLYYAVEARPVGVGVP